MTAPQPTTTSPTGAVLLYARARWRNGMGASLTTAVFVALAVASGVALLTASSRSESAFAALRAATRASDAMVVLDARPNASVADGQARALTRDARVTRASAETELFVRPKGSDYFPDFNLLAIAPVSPPGPGALDVPVIVAGRAIDQSKGDEILVSEPLANQMKLSVGDTIVVESLSDKWVEVAFNGGDAGPADGVQVRVHIVGLARSPADFGRWKAVMHLSAAFVAAYHDPAETRTYPRLHAQLSDQARRPRTLDVAGRHVEVEESPFADNNAADDGLATIGRALMLMAAAAVLAAGSVAAVSIGRQVNAGLRDRDALFALGWMRRNVTLAALVVVAPSVVAGTIIGAVAGVGGAGLAMVGLARRMHPHPDALAVNVGVVVAMTAGALVVGTLVSIFAARRAMAVRRLASRAAHPWVPLRSPLPAVLGVRRAFSGDSRLGGPSSWTALVVSAVAATIAVGALIVGASIGRLQVDPELTGQGGGRVIDSGESTEVYDRWLPKMEHDGRIAMLGGIHVVFGLQTAGNTRADLTALAYDMRRGNVGASIVEGRAAVQPDELTLGPRTLERLHQRVGGRIVLKGDGREATYRIVGSMLFPEGDFSYDDGVGLSFAAATRIVDLRKHEGAYQIVYDWAPRVDADAADRRLRAQGLTVFTNRTALQPPPVVNLGGVEAFPKYLAAFIVTLALVAFGHGLAVSRHRRNREELTLHALGMTLRSVAGIVAAQGAVIAACATVVGTGAGLVVGRWVWRAIGRSAHVVILPIVPWRSIATLMSAGAIVTLVLIAAVALHRPRRLPQDPLRAE